MHESEIKKDIRAFILETFLCGYDEGFEDDSSFQDDGIIDSTGVFELIDYVENTFQLKIDDNEIIPQNLDSLTKISAFVSTKLTNLHK
jgi:acyl carrier protein